MLLFQANFQGILSSLLGVHVSVKYLHVRRLLAQQFGLPMQQALSFFSLEQKWICLCTVVALF